MPYVILFHIFSSFCHEAFEMRWAYWAIKSIVLYMKRESRNKEPNNGWWEQVTQLEKEQK